jgi:plasmid maintenance system killer protein
MVEQNQLLHHYAELLYFSNIYIQQFTIDGYNQYIAQLQQELTKVKDEIFRNIQALETGKACHDMLVLQRKTLEEAEEKQRELYKQAKREIEEDVK